jgi:hypothetical protein
MNRVKPDSGTIEDRELTTVKRSLRLVASYRNSFGLLLTCTPSNRVLLYAVIQTANSLEDMAVRIFPNWKSLAFDCEGICFDQSSPCSGSTTPIPRLPEMAIQRGDTTTAVWSSRQSWSEQIIFVDPSSPILPRPVVIPGCEYPNAASTTSSPAVAATEKFPPLNPGICERGSSVSEANQ